MSKALLIRELIDAARKAGRHEVPLVESLTTRSRPVALKPSQPVTRVPARPDTIEKARQAGGAVVYMPVEQFRRIATPRNNSIPKPKPKPQAPRPGVSGPLAMLSDAGYADGLDIAENMSDLGVTHMPVELQRSIYDEMFGHGSASNFDRFSTKKIGSGQGAAVYGQGLYAAENPLVFNNSYRKDLGGRGTRSEVWFDDTPLSFVNNRPSYEFEGVDGSKITDAAYALAEKYGDLDSAVYGQRLLAQELRDEFPDVEAFKQRRPEVSAQGLERQLAFQRQAADDYDGVADILERHGDRFRIKPPGRTYEIGLRADPDQILDWDRDLLEQPGALGRLMAALSQVGRGPRSADIREVLEANMAPGQKYVGGGEGLYYDLGAASGKGDRGATKLLKDFGFKGHKYLDEFSRGRRDLDSADLTRNIVIYDDEPIDILDKYAKGGPVR